MLKRHEVLRSGIHFDVELQSFVQCIYREAEIPHVSLDYTKITVESEKLENFNAFLASDLNTPFDCEKPPLMRLAFFKFHNKKYRIVWTRHHILMGGASVKVVVSELFSVYKALLNKEEITLSNPVSYEEILGYQEELNANKDNTEQFWKKYLKGFTDAVSLPALLKDDKELKKINSLYSELNKEEYNRLRKFVDENNLTINTVIEGSWGLVLSNYTGKKKIVFGSVRAYPEELLKNSVGLFINVLPVMLNVSSLYTVEKYLRRIYNNNKILKKYIRTPLAKIKEGLGLSPDVLLYQSIVDYKPYSLNAMVQSFFKNTDCSVCLNLNIPYPLSLEVIKEEEFLKVNLHYDASLFEEQYAHSILLYFKQVLNELVTCPAENILSDISTLPLQDFELINQWNASYVDYPKHKTIHGVFEKQVERTPLAHALVYKNYCLSYKELNERANQLAHYLIESGVTLETVVAVYLKSAMDRVVAVLAILKSGGAYLPIDPAYPENRIQYLLEDSKPKMVITDSACVHLVNHLACAKTKCDFSIITVDTLDFSLWVSTNPAVSMQAKNLMYIIYTSGSTGKPKGVMVEHQAALNMALSCIARLGIKNDSRVLQVSSFSFDVFVAEWCMTLLSGASLYLIDGEVFCPDFIAKALREYKISAIILSGAILTVLPKVRLPCLKVIAVGGAPCSKSIVHFWSKNRLFLNVYGLTETAVCSTMAEYMPGQENTAIIGKPLSNTHIYILREDRKMLPIGVAGELCIGGDGVARGYVNNAKMTASKFIENSFQGRWYRTGDIARWLPSGELEFLGRSDEQVKIRGFRIELMEVEHALEKHPLVRKAVVIVSKAVNDKQLNAYLMCKNKATDADEIKRYIRLQLPHYMVPTHFFLIDQLPLTSNGKIDKEKLLSMPLNAPQIHSLEQHAALSALEKTLISIIQTVLQITDVPLHKNFFDMGFDSISLVYFSVKISEKLNLKMEVVTLFSHPTVRALSQYIKNSTLNRAPVLKMKNRHIDRTLFKTKKVKFINE